MRTKSTITSISYAGRVIIAPGGYFDGDAVSSSLETTASAVDLVNASYKHLESYKNASVSRSYAVVQDFDSVDDAILSKLDMEEFLSDNQTGDLIITIGEHAFIRKAAVSGANFNIALAPAGVRLTTRIDFVTGEEVVEET